MASSARNWFLRSFEVVSEKQFAHTPQAVSRHAITVTYVQTCLTKDTAMLRSSTAVSPTVLLEVRCDTVRVRVWLARMDEYNTNQAEQVHN
jgi:hypothetical protein